MADKEIIIAICSPKGEKRFETPINNGSKRVIQLSKDDYALLKFSVAEPVMIKVGDYADINGERLYVISLPQPSYNGDTGGYDYSLELCPGYKLWGNKMLFLNSGASAEADFKLTDSMEKHLALIQNAVKKSGFQFADTEGNLTDYVFDVHEGFTDEEKAKETLLVNYSSVTILDALDLIAATFECEWWTEGNRIVFGRCERGDIIYYERHDNVSGITPSGRDVKVPNRLYAFGGTDNIPPYYRRHLVFTVTRKEGYNIWDDNHPLKLGMFRKDVLSSDPDARKVISSFRPGFVQNLGDMEVSQTAVLTSQQATIDVNPPGSSYNFKLSQFKVSFRYYDEKGNVNLPSANSFDIALRIKISDAVYKGEENVGTGSTVIFEHKVTPSGGEPIMYINLDKQVTLTSERATVTFEVSVTKKNAFAKQTLALNSVSQLEVASLSSYDSADIILTNIRGGSSTMSAVFNPDHESDAGTPLPLRVGGPINVGDTFMIEGLARLNIPSSWFTSPDADPYIDAVASNRLRLPQDTPYIDLYDELEPAEVIEHVEIFDEVHPRQENSVTEVASYMNSANDGEFGKVFETFYLIASSGLPLDEDWWIAGVAPQIKFTSGRLNGMTFDLHVFNYGKSGVLEKPCLEIVANEDYGRKLPNTILKPEPGDIFILLGWCNENGYDLLIGEAESELKQRGSEWLQEKLTEGMTFDCPLIPAYAFEEGIPMLGQRVTLIEPTLFPKKDFVSRVISVEYPLDYPFDNPVVTVGEKIPNSRLVGVATKLRQQGVVSDFGSTVSDTEQTLADGTRVHIQVDLTNQTDNIVFNDLGELVGGLPETSAMVWVDGVQTLDFYLTVEENYPGLGFTAQGDTLKVSSADLSVQDIVVVQITANVNINGETVKRSVPFTLLRRRGDAKYQLLCSASSVRINSDGSVYPLPRDYRCRVMMTGNGSAKILEGDELEEASLAIEWRLDDEGEWKDLQEEDLNYGSGNKLIQFRLLQGTDYIDIEDIQLIEAGVEGKSLEDLGNVYLAGTSDSIPPEGTWVKDASKSGFSKELPCLWGKEILEYNTGKIKETEPHFMARWNEDGDPGRGILDIVEYYLATASESKPTFDESKWQTDQMLTGYSEALPFLWNVEKILFTAEPLVQISGPILIGHFGKDGKRARFQSTVFIRTNTKPERPTGGTYDSPLPTSLPLWSDGIPAGEQMLWASSRWFDEEEVTFWSEPRQMTDTATYDVEFARQQPNDAKPSKPDDSNRHGGSGLQIWFDPTLDSSQDFTQMYWRAEREKKNGEWGEWSIVRIKGEKGDKGEDGKDVYLLDLDNEMAGVIIDNDGKIVGDLPKSKATVYKGATIDTGWTFAVSGNGCVAVIDPITGELEIKEFLQSKCSARVTATKSGHSTLEAVMDLYSVSNGVIYSIEPDANSVSRFADGTLSQNKITATKYVTDGLTHKKTPNHWLRARIHTEEGAGEEETIAAPGAESGTVEINENITAVEFVLYDNTQGSGIFTLVLDRERVPVVGMTKKEFTRVKTEVSEMLSAERLGSASVSPATIELEDNKTYRLTLRTQYIADRITNVGYDIPSEASAWLRHVSTAISDSVLGAGGETAFVTFSTATIPTGAQNGEITFNLTLTGDKHATVVLSYTIQPKISLDDDGNLWIRGKKASASLKGKEGASVSSETTFFLASNVSSGIGTSSAGWSTARQSVSSTSPYLWTFRRTVMSDGRIFDTTPQVIGNYAKDGANGIDGKTWRPSISASGMLSWEESNSSAAPSPVNVKGSDGSAGRGILSVINYYAVTSVKTAPSSPAASSAPSSPWQTSLPTVTSTNKYLWNYERVQYSSGTTWEKTDPHIIGVYGDKGEQGDDGKKIHECNYTGSSSQTLQWWKDICNNTEWWNLANGTEFNVGDIALLKGTISDQDDSPCYAMAVVTYITNYTRIGIRNPQLFYGKPGKSVNVEFDQTTGDLIITPVETTPTVKRIPGLASKSLVDQQAQTFNEFKGTTEKNLKSKMDFRDDTGYSLDYLNFFKNADGSIGMYACNGFNSTYGGQCYQIRLSDSTSISGTFWGKSWSNGASISGDLTNVGSLYCNGQNVKDLGDYTNMSRSFNRACFNEEVRITKTNSWLPNSSNQPGTHIGLGQMELSATNPFIDFHLSGSGQTAVDYHARLIMWNATALSLEGVNFNCSGTINQRTSSDSRLKTGFGKKDYLSLISKLGDVYTFRYTITAKENNSLLDTDRCHTGLIYQNAIQADIPDFTGIDNNGYGFINWLSPDYQATLLGAFKQLADKVKTLEEEIKRLKENNNINP